MSVPCVDDSGKPYALRFTGGSRVRRISPTAPPDRASTGAEVITEPPVASTARFMELQPPGSGWMSLRFAPSALLSPTPCSL
jgi:hypothetical protein